MESKRPQDHRVSLEDNAGTLIPTSFFTSRHIVSLIYTQHFMTMVFYQVYIANPNTELL